MEHGLPLAAGCTTWCAAPPSPPSTVRAALPFPPMTARAAPLPAAGVLVETAELEAANGRAEREGARTAAKEQLPPPEGPSPPVREQGWGRREQGSPIRRRPLPIRADPRRGGRRRCRPGERCNWVESGRGDAGGWRCGAQRWWRRLGGRRWRVEKKERERKGRGEERRDVADKWTLPPRGVHVSETG
ncbi:hypothetical protein PVAP13_8KG385145 [Panicum virgatum]|uniref:Uncharacterized protein n=1 Tax=Panicum virgatum TaxID=38727 RepID=A0A8T0Q1E1_PANVG|nr:hypothetical protein PVAP13_8KG385145 [Panicum virgatum]